MSTRGPRSRGVRRRRRRIYSTTPGENLNENRHHNYHNYHTTGHSGDGQNVDRPNTTTRQRLSRPRNSIRRLGDEVRLIKMTLNTLSPSLGIIHSRTGTVTSSSCRCTCTAQFLAGLAVLQLIILLLLLLLSTLCQFRLTASTFDRSIRCCWCCLWLVGLLLPMEALRAAAAPVTVHRSSVLGHDWR